MVLEQGSARGAGAFPGRTPASMDAPAPRGAEEPAWTEVARQFECVGKLARLMLQRNPGLVLSGAEVDVLTHLALSSQDVTPGDVIRETGIGKEALSRLLRSLVGGGFVERIPNPRDGRSVLLRITPAGRVELERTYGSALRPMYALLRGLGREDYDRLMDLIGRAAALLEGESRAEGPDASRMPAGKGGEL